MDYQNFIAKSKEAVAQHEAKAGVETSPQDVYVVWYCKTLQNAKALLSTNTPNGMYYETTYNGDKNEMYFDAYKKDLNVKIEF